MFSEKPPIQLKAEFLTQSMETNVERKITAKPEFCDQSKLFSEKKTK